MMYVCEPVFLISSYGAPLAHRAFYLAQHSSLFGPNGTINYYDCIVTSAINSLLISSKCIPNGAQIMIVKKSKIYQITNIPYSYHSGV